MSEQWQKIRLRVSDSLHRAIEVIDQGAKQIALVLDDDGRLIGTVTDGDIRRGILRHLSLEAPVSEVMNAKPRSLAAGYSRAEALQLLGSAQVLQVPIVDRDGKLVGLETMTDLMKRPRLENPVFLMAGGFGTRLRPLTDSCPKPMLKVGGKPMLEHILQDLIDYGFYRFYISVHYLREQVIEHFKDGSRFGVSIQYIHEDTPLGTAGCLGLLPRDAVQRPIIVVNGDIMTRVNYEALLQDHDRHTPAATVCTRQYDFQVPYGVIEHEDQRITNITEKPTQHFFVSAGIYVLAPQVVHSMAADTRVDMPDLLKSEITAGRSVRMFPVHEYWLDIGRMNDFELAQNDAASVLQRV
ncbi:nucleotidyltransferase family protein [Halothiobacillus neapolitanus]|uniref:Nucleotidyl transferase n=1 Tax=Halothiobacillus neapolitanus (strain ATCC 23641 / DSM 15147 / CIP 104769 / NCIMB 8539 / c2) TaxID=555778 RepID=D0KYG3_HALNC|nr:nucleotidyltransferase family protein [Halothiobacillus neapolitanus]ACX95486.1 Nucleotidyl transferase [Halothiobacillus neapolitanus c2]TDN65783.1 CBS domain protein [Halothiobacillus neapolitanus]